MSFEITRQELLKQANELLRKYNLSLNPETKAEEVRIRRIAADLETLTGLGSQTLQDVTDNGATTTHSITANAFIKSGGTSSQFLKADGSVDSTTYLSTADVLNSFLLMGG